jgi:phytanoyl-CoA hydroxylase
MVMERPDAEMILEDYERDGVALVRGFLSPDEVGAIREELDRYIREELESKPADARTLESDEKTVRNLWRLEVHNEFFREFAARRDLRDLIAPLVKGEPVPAGVETFNKPARIGSGVPPHQDNAYFCQTPPDMLTVWIAIDAVTEANGPVTYVKGSHRLGPLPTKPSGVRGNSIGLAGMPEAGEGDLLVALLAPGDATIHHCNTIHYSSPNTTDHPRLGFLLVFRGGHTQTDPSLKVAYAAAVAATPPA